MTGRAWEIADAYLATRSALDPAMGEVLGQDREVLVPDLTPDGFADRYAVDRRARLQLGEDPSEPLGQVLADWLDGQIALYDSGFITTLAAPLATPIHQLRQLFDDLPRLALSDWERVGRNLDAVSQGYGDYARTLANAIDAGHQVSASQALNLAAQVRSWIDPAGTAFYRSLVADAPAPLARPCALAAEAATRAAAAFADTLERDILPRAQDRVGVGAEQYAVTSTAFLGATTDAEELYEYGWTALAKLRRRYRELGQRLTNHTHIPAIRTALDQRPGAQLPINSLLPWLQERLDYAADHLTGQGHFTLPDGTLPVEARLATAASGVMYYAPGDSQRTRPGRVWWTVPDGTTHVATWREVSTVHHEGLPGHHLQSAISAGLDDLHPFQRHVFASHGYAEGWAHYAEGLADEVGLVRDGAERLGVMDAQAWRLARIVIDVGLHLDLPVPRGQDLVEAERWSPGVARAALEDVSGLHPDMARFEIDRYLGWPGQALAFAVGARLWRAAREAARTRAGPGFDLADFHARALGMGPMGLGLLNRRLETEEAEDPDERATPGQ